MLFLCPFLIFSHYLRLKRVLIVPSPLKAIGLETTAVSRSHLPIFARSPPPEKMVPLLDFYWKLKSSETFIRINSHTHLKAIPQVLGGGLHGQLVADKLTGVIPPLPHFCSGICVQCLILYVTWCFCCWRRTRFSEAACLLFMSVA